MGRKLHRKVVTRPRPSLPTIFECPRCEAEAVKIEIKEHPVRIATVMCGNCHITKTFTELKRLHDKVDIFGIWVDNFYEELERGEASEEYETETPVTDTDATDEKDSKENNEDISKDSTQTISKESPKTTISSENDDITKDEDEYTTEDDDLDEDDNKKKYDFKIRK
ncbi:MAG: hypothetical protein HeimC3_47620 [Candidatus Heimdallarchaeota archaeon LC_3]|nr:MAG: hypothetical protein HeimC3_47620 [Candidatus Heimdallarchaeota archaeon LC_3]